MLGPVILRGIITVVDYSALTSTESYLMKNEPVYHYTTGNKLSLISASQGLIPTSVMIAPKEKPVLWFSKDSDYEPTAIKLIMRSDGKAYRPTMKELHELIGLYRFSFSPRDNRLLTFSQLQRVAHISPQGMSAMVASGLRIGAKPTNWFGVMTAVPLSELIFEEWTGSAWVPAQLQEAVERVCNSGLVIQSKSAYALGLTNAW